VFIYVLLGLLAGAAAHAAFAKERTRQRIAEILLLWLLVGYCGLATGVHSVVSLLDPAAIARYHGFSQDSPFQAFASTALLGMSVMSVLALVYRGTFLIAPATCWAVFFAGATVIHLHDTGQPHSHGALLATFATHGLISVLLCAALLASGVLRRRN
jgi:hypothetical protein